MKGSLPESFKSVGSHQVDKVATFMFQHVFDGEAIEKMFSAGLKSRIIAKTLLSFGILVS